MGKFLRPPTSPIFCSVACLRVKKNCALRDGKKTDFARLKMFASLQTTYSNHKLIESNRLTGYLPLSRFGCTRSTSLLPIRLESVPMSREEMDGDLG